MGLLALGTPLDWQQAKGYAGHVREHGIEQFLKIWHRLKDRTGDVLLWGDEVSSPYSGNVCSVARLAMSCCTLCWCQIPACRAENLDFRGSAATQVPARIIGTVHRRLM